MFNVQRFSIAAIIAAQTALPAWSPAQASQRGDEVWASATPVKKTFAVHKTIHHTARRPVAPNADLTPSPSFFTVPQQSPAFDNSSNGG